MAVGRCRRHVHVSRSIYAGMSRASRQSRATGARPASSTPVLRYWNVSKENVPEAPLSARFCQVKPLLPDICASPPE